MLPLFFFLMIRRPPRSTLDRSSAASDVYKRQDEGDIARVHTPAAVTEQCRRRHAQEPSGGGGGTPVSYTHLRAHETVLDIVCRLLLEKTKRYTTTDRDAHYHHNRVVTTQRTVRIRAQ